MTENSKRNIFREALDEVLKMTPEELMAEEGDTNIEDFFSVMEEMDEVVQSALMSMTRLELDVGFTNYPFSQIDLPATLVLAKTLTNLFNLNETLESITATEVSSNDTVYHSETEAAQWLLAA